MALLTRQTRQKAVRRHGIVALLVAVCAGAACDKVPLMAPTESLITLFANATSIPINGTVEITATVIESAGTPVQNGTVVQFFTSLGRIEPFEARTQNGRATVRLHAGSQSGMAIVRAASGGNGTKDPQLEIAIGGAAASRVELFASPAVLPSTGGTVQLTAIVYDAGGNRLPSVQVSFSADNGNVSPNIAITDGSGEARSALTATGAVKVTVVVAGSADKAVSGTLDVKLRAAPDVTLAVATTTPTERQPVTFTVTVKPGTAGAAVSSAVLAFGDGNARAVSTNGTSSATHTYTTAGTYTAVLTATDVAGETSTATTSVLVRTPAPIGVTLTASPASPTVNSPVAFTATATVPTGSTVDRYEWSFGNGAVRTTTGGSTSYVYTTGGRFTVTVRVVTTDGASGTAQTDIVVTGMSVTLSASNTTPTAGTTSVVFTATVTPSTTAMGRYEWDFGDGTTGVTFTGSATANTAKTYGLPTGHKTVTVRAIAADGTVAIAQILIEVK